MTEEIRLLCDGFCAVYLGRRYLIHFNVPSTEHGPLRKKQHYSNHTTEQNRGGEMLKDWKIEGNRKRNGDVPLPPPEKTWTNSNLHPFPPTTAPFPP